MNIICLDAETTGLNRYDDEILQLSIIDGSGAILFSEYVKPVRHERWTDAEKVNHISPSMIKDCKPLLYYAHTLKTCAEYYSYSEDSWHNALDDAKATLFCFYKIFGDVPEVPVYATGVYRSVDNIIKHEDQKPVEVVPVPKSGNILIGFGIFMLLGFFVAFNPVCVVIAAPLLYFGFKRHKAYKEFKQNKRKQ